MSNTTENKTIRDDGSRILEKKGDVDVLSGISRKRSHLDLCKLDYLLQSCKSYRVLIFQGELGV